MEENTNSFGVKFLKSLFIFVVGFVVLWFILDIAFSIFGPIISALPFETPTNFVVADFIGIFVMIVTFAGLIITTKNFGWK